MKIIMESNHKITKMNKVIKVIRQRNYSDMNITHNSAEIKYRKYIDHKLECGHIVRRHGDRSLTPSKRLKCKECESHIKLESASLIQKMDL